MQNEEEISCYLAEAGLTFIEGSPSPDGRVLYERLDSWTIVIRPPAEIGRTSPQVLEKTVKDVAVL